MSDEDEIRWVTYSELGLARGISRASAERLARKKRWSRTKGNTGLARVAVPLPWLTADEPAPPAGPHDQPHDRPPAATGDMDAVSALREAIAGLLVRAERAESEADRERKRAERAETRADEATNRAILAEQAIAGERNRADRAESAAIELRNQLDDLSHQLREAQTAVRSMAERASQQVGRAAEAEADLRRELEEAQAAAGRHHAEAQDARGRLAVLEAAEEARRGRGLIGQLLAAWRGKP